MFIISSLRRIIIELTTLPVGYRQSIAASRRSSCYQISAHYRKPTEMKLLSEFSRSRADNGCKIFRETCTATTHPPVERPPLFLHLQLFPSSFSFSSSSGLLQHKRYGGKEKGTEIGCFAIRVCPRIPERRLSPLPLNIHPLGKPDKNKEKTRPTILPRSLSPSRKTRRAGFEIRLQRVGNLIFNSNMLPLHFI